MEFEQEIKAKLDKVISSLKHDFSGLRTGRANTSLLDEINVTAYGQSMPLNQVANVSIPEPRTLTISVWDQGNVKDVEKAILNSSLGITPNVEGSKLILNLPDLTTERRTELTKVAKQKTESAKISMRNIRHEYNDKLKKQEKNKEISEDELKTFLDEIQKTIDNYISNIDNLLINKQDEIMEV